MEPVTTVEDIERRQRFQRFLFRSAMVLLLLIVCVLIGWIISLVGYKGIDYESSLLLPGSWYDDQLFFIRA